MKQLIVILILVLLPALVTPDQSQVQTDKDRLEYEVTVDARLVPVYAVDKKGNPVFDLKKEDFELHTDGKPTEIISFNAFQVETTRKTPGEPSRRPGQPAGQTPEAPQKAPERIIFIVVDTILGNRDIIKPAREVILRLLDRAAPGDGFILMESSANYGLRYIIGPEKNKQTLIRALGKMEESFYARQTVVKGPALRNMLALKNSNSGNKQFDNSIEQAMREFDQALGTAESEKKRYINDIRLYTRSIQQLKYALKTIPFPKTFFLISPGPMRAERSVLNIHIYKQLIKAAQAINLGGSALYIVNPREVRTLAEKNALKFMTDNVKGKFIYGQDFDDVVEKIKTSTSAYYELAFYSREKGDRVNRLKLTCKRKDVELISVGYSEKTRPYLKMNDTEKELFALSVINRGSWSRITSKIGRIPYKKIQASTSKKKPDVIQLNIPPFMQNRKLDLFVVHVNPKTGKADFQFQRKSMAGTETIEIFPKKKRNAYFVIIEPDTPICIYNQVM